MYRKLLSDFYHVLKYLLQKQNRCNALRLGIIQYCINGEAESRLE